MIKTVVENNYFQVSRNLEAEGYQSTSPQHAIDLIKTMYGKKQFERVDFILRVEWIPGISGIAFDEAVRDHKNQPQTKIAAAVTTAILGLVGSVSNVAGGIIGNAQNKPTISPTLQAIEAEKAAKAEAERKKKNLIVIGSVAAILILAVAIYYGSRK